MLHVVEGNLLTSDCSVMAHQANCQGVMGSGIAKQIRQQFPEAYRAFKHDGRAPKEKLGTYSAARCGDVLVYNLYGQLHFGRFNVVYTDYDALKWSIIRMIRSLNNWNDFNREIKIGLPYGIGCGLANGDWKIVLPMLQKVSAECSTDMYLYKYLI